MQVLLSRRCRYRYRLLLPWMLVRAPLGAPSPWCRSPHPTACPSYPVLAPLSWWRSGYPPGLWSVPVPIPLPGARTMPVPAPAPPDAGGRGGAGPQ